MTVIPSCLSNFIFSIYFYIYIFSLSTPFTPSPLCLTWSNTMNVLTSPILISHYTYTTPAYLSPLSSHGLLFSYPNHTSLSSLCHYVPHLVSIHVLSLSLTRLCPSHFYCFPLASALSRVHLGSATSSKFFSL